jgi:predicted heme/steroid binding protein
MDIPDRIVSILELRRSTGERGTRKFIAFNGVVYDVTDCPKWRNDMRENPHFAGTGPVF